MQTKANNSSDSQGPIRRHYYDQVLALNGTCSIRYSLNLVPDCMTHIPETGTSFLVPVSGTFVMGIADEHFKHQILQ